MSNERDRVGEEESVAMTAAEEAEYVNERQPEQPPAGGETDGRPVPPSRDGLEAAASPSHGEGIAATGAPGGARLSGWLLLLSAAAALAASLLLFLPALRDGLRYVVAPAARKVAPDLGAELTRAVDRLSRSAILLVQSTPAGATVAINGVERGSTPAVVDVECAAGDRVSVDLTAEGFEPRHDLVTCPAEGDMRLELELKRREAASSPGRQPRERRRRGRHARRPRRP